MKYKKISYGDEIYPSKLYSLPKPPKELYCIGDISLLKNKIIAIVGSRRASSYGQTIATKLAYVISKAGGTVVSGMAAGIDTCGHSGALREKGSTIAVLGCGVDICYPKSNWSLKNNIEKEGLIISEYPLGQEPQKWTFPQRNRIIAALSDIVVVVEAGLNSGAIITAEIGAELGKDVLAVPSNINSMYGIGSNKLIFDGAIPLISFSDVLEYASLDNTIIDEASLYELSDEERIVYEAVCSTSETSSAMLSKDLGIEIKKINIIVTMLEVKGFLQTAMGRIFIKK